MRKLSCLMCLVCALAWAALCVRDPEAFAQQGEPSKKAAQAEHYAGIALIASGVGSDYAVDDLVAFVEAARVRQVVVDWAWITAHWDRSRFDDVEKLVQRLKSAKVEVTAMYRPRFFESQSDKIGVKYQVDEKGEGGPKREIDYSDEKARQWGTKWATEILKKCPSFDEVTIYNPIQRSLSKECLEAKAKDPKFDTNCVKTFLEETRKAMREIKKDAKLGLVLPPSATWYAEFSDVIDVPRPYVFVRPDAKIESDMDSALEVMKAFKTPGPALAKITWDETTRVTDAWLADFIATAKKKKLPYCFWTFETTFLEGIYDLDKLCAALGVDGAKLKPIIAKLGGKGALSKEQIEKELKEAAQSTASDGYMKLIGLAQKYGDMAVEPLVKLLDDKKQTDDVRWRAAGALGATASAKAVEALLRNSSDSSEMVRWLCAAALGFCGRGNEAARKRLKEMAESDPVERVRETAKRSLDLLDGQPPEAAAPPSDGRDVFLDALPWAPTLEAALKQGKLEGRPVIAFVVPFYHARHEAGYEGCDVVAAKDTADMSRLVPETGFNKELAMLTGMLAEPRVVELLKRRFVAVRMRLNLHQFWFKWKYPDIDPFAAHGLNARDLGGPSIVCFSPEGKLEHKATRLSVFSPVIMHRLCRALLAGAPGANAAQAEIDKAMDALGESASTSNFRALAELLVNCGEFEKAAALLEKPPAALAPYAQLLRAEMALLDGDLAKVQVQLKSARALREDAPWAACLQAELYAQSRDWAVLSAASEKALKEAPQGAERLRLRYWQAFALDALGRRKEAWAKFKELEGADAAGPWGARARRHITYAGPNPFEWWGSANNGLAKLAGTESDFGGETEAIARTDQAVERAVDYLLIRQRHDGAWEGPLNGREQSPVASSQWDFAVVARTALCVCALRAASPRTSGERGRQVAAAITHGAAFVRSSMESMLGEIWTVTYMLHMELDFYPGLKGKERAECEARVAKLIATIARLESGGGWAYPAPQKGRLHTFNTAPVLLLLLRAKSLSLKVDEAMLKRAGAFIESQRVGKAAVFHYGPTMEALTTESQPQGSSMRSPLCELALLEGGFTKGDARVNEALELFFKHLDEVRRTCKTWEHFFEPSIMQDAYHYYFGTYYAACAMGKIENATARQANARKLLAAVLRTQELDGSFVDAQLTTGKNVSTALALLTMEQCTQHAAGEEKRR